MLSRAIAGAIFLASSGVAVGSLDAVSLLQTERSRGEPLGPQSEGGRGEALAPRGESGGSEAPALQNGSGGSETLALQNESAGSETPPPQNASGTNGTLEPLSESSKNDTMEMINSIDVEAENMSARCPDIRPLSSEDFDMKEFARASWFIQERQSSAHLAVPEFRCLVSTYEQDKTVLGSDPLVRVYNYRLGGYRTAKKYTSDVPEPSGATCAKASPDGSGALKSVPCAFALGESLGGDYWVIKVGKGKAAGEYESAVVIGGKPTEYNAKTDTCTTKTGPFANTNTGLWILSRTPVMDPVVVQKQKDWLTRQRVDTSRLYAVRQGDGWCSDYPGALLKEAPVKMNPPIDYQG